jgi:hypothetical protein
MKLKQFLKDSPDSYYVTEIISENIARDNRDFLICTNVIAARTGTQEYLGKEIGVADPSLHDTIFYLERPAEEVFSEKTLKSFDNAPFTDGHPFEKNVNSKNSKTLLKGFVRNARKADFKDDNGNELLIVDVVVTDEALIKLIENGKREVSAGYSWKHEVVNFDQRRIKVTEIRANHLALVHKGRAGSAMIMDEEGNELEKLVLIEKIENPKIIGGNVMDQKEFKFKADVNGEEKTLVVRGFDTKEEAKEAALELLKDENLNKEEK